MSNHNIFLTLHFDEKLVFFCNFKNSSHFQEKGHFTDVKFSQKHKNIKNIG